MSTYSNTCIFVVVPESDFDHWKSMADKEVTRYDPITGKPHQVRQENVSFHIENLKFPGTEDFQQIEWALENGETNEGDKLTDGFSVLMTDDCPEIMKLDEEPNYGQDYDGEYGIGYTVFSQFCYGNGEMEKVHSRKQP